MQDKIKQRVLDAFLLVMRPVVRILLRYGIGYREFAEVTKTAFVDVASADFGLRGRPTNISRVAVMTGLTRKEVKRLRDKLAVGETTVAVKTTPLADVLHHWHADKDFTDAAGNPRPLPFAGEEISFTNLVKKFGGDIPAGAMRTEMKRVGAVSEDNDGNLSLMRRSIVAGEHHENVVTMLVHGVYTVLSTIEHNTNPDRKVPDWGYRIAYTQKLKSLDTGQLRRIAADRISDFAESIDDLFIAYEALHEEEDGTKSKDAIAIGVFYFEERDKNADYEW